MSDTESRLLHVGTNVGYQTLVDQLENGQYLVATYKLVRNDEPHVMRVTSHTDKVLVNNKARLNLWKDVEFFASSVNTETESYETYHPVSSTEDSTQNNVL